MQPNARTFEPGVLCEMILCLIPRVSMRAVH
jgi:hypothetical protein